MGTFTDLLYWSPFYPALQSRPTRPRPVIFVCLLVHLLVWDHSRLALNSLCSRDPPAFTSQVLRLQKNSNSPQCHAVDSSRKIVDSRAFGEFLAQFGDQVCSLTVGGLRGHTHECCVLERGESSNLSSSWPWPLQWVHLCLILVPFLVYRRDLSGFCASQNCSRVPEAERYVAHRVWVPVCQSAPMPVHLSSASVMGDGGTAWETASPPSFTLILEVPVPARSLLGV